MALSNKLCPQCGNESPVATQFCSFCGAHFAPIYSEPAPYVCDKCETILPGGSRFCPGCGQAFDEAVPEITPPSTSGFRQRPASPNPVPVILHQPQTVPVSVQIKMPSLPALSPVTGPRVNYSWFGEALQLFQSQAGIWIVATLAQLIFCLLGSPPIHQIDMAGYLPDERGAIMQGQLLRWLIFPPSFVMLCRLNCATHRMANKQVRGDKLAYGDIWRGGPGVVPVLGLTVLMYIALLAGIAAFIIPGLLVLGLASPAYALAAEGINVFDALQRSIVAMKRDWLNATVIAFLCWLLILVSMLPCGLGLLITYPIYKLIISLACRDMIGMPKSLDTETSPAGSNIKETPPVVSHPNNQTKSSFPHQTKYVTLSTLKSISATRGTIILVGSLTVGCCLLIGFWLVRRAHMPVSNPVSDRVAKRTVSIGTLMKDGGTMAPEPMHKLVFPVHWGAYTVTREDVGDGDNKQQKVRISNAQGKTLWEAEDAEITSVTECHIIGIKDTELEISTDAGAHYRNGTVYFLSRINGLYLLFTNNSSGEGGFDVIGFTVFNQYSRPQMQVTFSILAFDGLPHSAEKELHCVYIWDGSHYINATEKFSQDAQLYGREAQAKYLKHWQENPTADYVGGNGNDDGEDSADRQDAIKYWANAMAAGQGEEAKDWLMAHANSNLASHFLQIEGDLQKLIPQEGAPLEVTMGDGKNLDQPAAITAETSSVTDNTTAVDKPIFLQPTSPDERDPLKETAVPGSGLADQALDLDTLQHRMVTDEDLSGRSLAALSASYNAIYAVHGYVFKRPSLQRLFSRLHWYTPNPAFQEQDLSSIEQANLKTIRSYEKTHFGF